MALYRSSNKGTRRCLRFHCRFHEEIDDPYSRWKLQNGSLFRSLHFTKENTQCLYSEDVKSTPSLDTQETNHVSWIPKRIDWNWSFTLSLRSCYGICRILLPVWIGGENQWNVEICRLAQRTRSPSSVLSAASSIRWKSTLRKKFVIGLLWTVFYVFPLIVSVVILWCFRKMFSRKFQKQNKPLFLLYSFQCAMEFLLFCCL